MLKYLIKILFIVGAGLYISNIYYNDFSFHKENFNGYTPYILFILISYIFYKIYSIFINYKETLEFSPLNIFGIFLYQLLFFSFFFFSISGSSSNSGLILFISVLGYLIIPFLVSIFSYSFGEKIIYFLEKKYGKNEEKEDNNFLFLMSLGLGFSSFIFFLTIIGTFGFYNIYGVIILLVLMGIFSYKNLINSFKNLYTYKIKIENHKIYSDNFLDKLNPYLLSTEFLFIVISLLISTNFISIFRPTPIGWDDMGVYMNYPQLMAGAGELLSLGLVAWQTLTGIGFIIGSATQAFFINNLGSILSIIVLTVSFSSLLKSTKKTFINIPLLLATIFLTMPMIVFQQAKDMKLDTGLFFVSSIVIFGIIHIFIKYLGYKKQDINNLSTEGFSLLQKISFQKFKNYFTKNTVYGEANLFDNKKYLFYLFILGIIAGFAFTIKVTSLLLISGIFGILFYTKLGFSGFLGYLSIFFGIFTKLGLWDYMGKINYPKDNIEFKNMFFAISMTIGITFILYSINKYKIKAFTKLLTLIGVFLAGILLFLSPFFAKHISETISNDKKITIGTIISGSPDRFTPDYTKILSKKELKEIKKKTEKKAKEDRKAGKTKNEDFGRYFGYENGINNYVKLPMNLTMQKNQKGEFTDITYIYLALIPIIFLFLNFKNSFATGGILLILLLESLIFVVPVGKQYFTDIFSKLEFPFGYLILLGIFLSSLFLFIYGLKKDKNSQIFRLISVFLVFYIFLWSIAAFGVIWYGIAMFYGLLLIIGIALFNISSYTNDEIPKSKIIKVFGTFSIFLIVSIYFFSSTFPHSFKNMKNSGYAEFKSQSYGAPELTFGYNLDRLEVLFALNIDDNLKQDFLKEIINNTKNEIIIGNFGKQNKKGVKVFSDVKIFENVLKSFEMQVAKKLYLELVNKNPKYKKINLNVKTIKNYKNILNNNKIDFELLDSIDSAKKELYKKLLKPEKKYKNTKNIYRIGTFYKYFITENNKRFYEDSLITNYHKYFKTGKIEENIENMKKIGLSYILMDVNAATIDNDPRHDLTLRYENLLKLILAKNVELISSDNICLKIAIESYNKKEIDIKKYLKIAGVNYDSYENGKRISRNVKKNECLNYMLKLKKSKKIDKNNYSELIGITKTGITRKQLVEYMRKLIGKNGGSYALFKLK